MLPPLRDIGASVVVFFVALPLCLGVAIASGVPPAVGIVSGIVGGIVVGILSGSPLQVSGPAAGLIVSVWTIINGWGLEALGLGVLISGAVQLAAAALRAGRWFRAVSPALIGGMLAGIGVLIGTSQLYVMVGAEPPAGGGLAWLWFLGGAWKTQMATPNGPVTAAVGLGTVVALVLWDKYRPKRLLMVPGPLVVVGLATLITTVFALPVACVELPPSLTAVISPVSVDHLGLLADPGFWGASLALGFVAAAESLLCANGTDLLHDGPRTKYDKELFALGVGNLVCGVLGALPVTGVIVRSSANIQAGATSRWSTVIHGFLLLGLVAFAPALLAYIPVAALAGVLVHVGGKLLAPKKAHALYKAGPGEFWVFAGTVSSIYVFGLLSGIVIGLGLALLKLLYTFSHLEVEVNNEGDRYDIDVHGAATFVQLPKLAEALEQIPETAEVHVHIGALAYIDHACAELLHGQQERRERAGGQLHTEWDEVQRLREQKPLVKRGASSQAA